MARSLGRIVFALMGAAFGAIAVGLTEARLALAASDALHAPAFADVALAEVGVLAPLAMLVGIFVAAATLFLEPGRSISPRERFAMLRAEPVLVRSRTAALALLGSLSAALWLVVTAHVAQRLLADGAPLAAGGALAVRSLAWLGGLGALTLALLPLLRRGLAAGASSWPRLLDPVATGAVGLGMGVLLVGVGVAMGDTGGEGAGPLAIFGVLKRGELDLRPVVNLGVVAACAWIGPLALRGRPPRPLPLAVSLALIAGPLFLTTREAHALDADAAVAQTVERYAPLGRIALALDRKATDRDHDGTSPLFGGGDCNDRDPLVSPLAVDIPGNGIDEDCTGADLPAARPRDPEPAAATGPKIDRDFDLLFITVDTLRAGELGFLGYDKPTSPNLDALAAESVVFERTYAMASYTGKALAPMLIGKYPSETARDGGHFNVYAPSNTFLAERLRDAGFTTMGAASHWYFKERFGVTQGISPFDLTAMPSSGQGDTDSTTTGAQVTDAAIAMLKARAGSGRFMLWTHYFDPHAQYVAHPGAPDFLGSATGAAAKQHAAYDGEIWFTDQQVGRLLDYARTQPWWKDTVVVLTSDHGEALDEHGIHFQHGWEIWEPLMRVPLVIRVPGMAARKIAVKRSAVDIVPTVLDLMRVPPPAPGELSGQSLLPDMAPQNGESPAERDVYLDMPDGPYTHMRRGLIHGATPGMKLVHLGGRQYQLYDLANDPGEREDLSGDPAKLQPMLDALAAKRATLHEIQVRADAPAGN